MEVQRKMLGLGWCFILGGWGCMGMGRCASASWSAKGKGKMGWWCGGKDGNEIIEFAYRSNIFI
jgi:hypothetical protein